MDMIYLAHLKLESEVYMYRHEFHGSIQAFNDFFEMLNVLFRWQNDCITQIFIYNIHLYIINKNLKKKRNLANKFLFCGI